MALGIRFELTTPIAQNVTLGGFEVTDITLDFAGGEAIIAYEQLDGTFAGVNQERSVSLTPAEASALFTQAQDIATNNSETVIRALYYAATAEVRDRLGVIGTVTVA